MSVQKRRTRRGTKWVVRWEEEGRHRQRTQDTREEAIALDAEMKARMRRRRRLGGFAPQEASPMTLGAYIELCWRRRSLDWEQTTRDTWSDVLDSWIVPMLGRLPLRDLNRSRVRDFRTQMLTEGVRTKGGRRRKATNNRANAVMTVLSAFLGYAVEEELIPHNPCHRIRKLPHKASAHRAHLPIVLERIRAQMQRRDALMVSLMYLAGLRPEEALGLQWRHVGEQVLVVEQAATGGTIKGTKTGASSPMETVEICAPLREDLIAYRASLRTAPRPDDLVIRGREGTGVLTLRYWRTKIWHPARIAAGLERSTPYDCRHTFGSLLIHEGRDILEVQRAMRHANSNITLSVYAHEFAEWKGRKKAALVKAVNDARAKLAAERARAARNGDRAGALSAAPSGRRKRRAPSVARKLRDTPQEGTHADA